MAQRRPDNPTLYVMQSGSRASQGHDRDANPLAKAHQGAREQLGRQLEENEFDPSRSVVMAWVLLRRGQVQEAVSLLEKLALMEPENPRILTALAMALEKSGDVRLAREVEAYAATLRDPE